MGIKSEDAIAEEFRNAHHDLDKCPEISGSQGSLCGRILELVRLYADAKRTLKAMGDLYDAAGKRLDEIEVAPNKDLETRVVWLVSRHKQALAKIEYLKSEFAKLSAWVMAEQESMHNAQRIIGAIYMQLDAAERKKAAGALLN